MKNKFLISLLFVISNILLYSILSILGKESDLLWLFILVRITLTTSLIMQILMAIGFVKIAK